MAVDSLLEASRHGESEILVHCYSRFSTPSKQTGPKAECSALSNVCPECTTLADYWNVVGGARIMCITWPFLA